MALSWRDIKSPNAGGAEVNTHELLKHLSQERYHIVHISPLYQNLNKKEVIDGITYIRYGNIFSVILFAIQFYRRYRKEIDFVIDQCNTHRFFTPLWVEGNKRIFLIYQLTRDIWDINLTFPFNKLGKILENPLLKMYNRDITITESESTKRDLITVGFHQENIFVVPVIMKLKPWKTTEFLEKSEIPQFVYVGRYAKYKGIDVAVEAMGLMKKNKIKAQLIILGKKNEGYIRSNLLPICRKYDLKIYFPKEYEVIQGNNEYKSSDIIFAGFVSEDDKLVTLSRAKALVFPSNREGWGIPVSEAAYVGTPSIIFNSEGLIDAVDNGKAGFVCKEKSARGVYEQMKTVLEKDDLYNNMVSNAYLFSKQYLDVDVNKIMDKIFRIVRKKDVLERRMLFRRMRGI